VAGAVYRPVEETVPPVAAQVTAVLLLPVTLAVNCCVPPVVSDAVVGDTETATTGGGVAEVTVIGNVVESEPPPPPVLSDDTPEAYRVAVPAVAGAVQFMVQLTELPVNDFGELCVTSLLSNLVIESTIANAPPADVDTSSPPTTAAPPVTVNVYVLVEPAVTVCGPLRVTAVGRGDPAWQELQPLVE
jgi:hypothetical protein